MTKKLAYRRVIVKVSGEYLGKETTIDPQRLSAMAKELAAVHALGAQMGVVVGGGNIFRGRQASAQSLPQITVDHMGMLGTVINGLALREALLAEGVEVALSSAFPVGNFAPEFQIDKVEHNLKKGRICLFVGGTGNPFFTTDTTAALRALQIYADIVLKATDVDGVYDQDPKINPQAKKYDQITFQKALDEKLGVMDASAFALCAQYQIPIGVFKFEPGALVAVISGEAAVGTLVTK